MGLSVAASDSEPQRTEECFQIVPVGVVSQGTRDRILSFNGDRETSKPKPGLIRGQSYTHQTIQNLKPPFSPWRM